MNADQLLGYLNQQELAIQALVKQLDEVQVAFNAQFDQFQTRHNATLTRLSDLLAGRLDALPAEPRAAVEERLPVERQLIDERRQQVQTKYLPERQQAANDLLKQAQAEMADLRVLNPQLNDQEESLKSQKAELEAQLTTLNDQIRQQSRGVGVVTHFASILTADRERQRIVGQLEMLNGSLLDVRRQWESKQEEVSQHQAELQAKWQMESVAVARLQAELDQLGDPIRAEDLAVRRSIYRVLDDLKRPASSPDPEVDAGLQEMIELNVQTDTYHEGLAAVGGMIGLLRGIASGLGALRESVQGLNGEQEMHSAYLKPLSFGLPPRVEAFHRQWAILDQQFADEKTIGAHPAEFSAVVRPLVEGQLSQAGIEAMFNDLGVMIKQATSQWR